MRFTNSFAVPLPVDHAWTTLTDIEVVVPCGPGAELQERVDPKTYKGKISIKLGPMALTFVGTARFEEIDAAAHRTVVKAQGNDAEWRGSAAAAVPFAAEPSPVAKAPPSTPIGGLTLVWRAGGASLVTHSRGN